MRHRLGHGPPVPQPLPDQPDLGAPTAPTPARTGAWNGATGNSGGFQDWEIDLSRLQGQAGRGLDHLRAGLRGVAVSACSSTRLQILKDGAVTESNGLRDRSRPVGRRPAAGRAPRTTRRGSRAAPSASPRARASRPRTPCCGASASRASRRGPSVSAALKDALTYLHAFAAGDAAGRRARRPRRTATSAARRRRRQRAGDAVADARPGGDVRRVHARAREDVLRHARRRT